MNECCTGDREKKRFQAIAARLPFLKGTIIAEDGTTVDISDLFDVAVSKADPQLAKAQTFTPYVKDKVLLQDGRVCSLLDLIKSLLNKIDQAGLVYTPELRLTYVELTFRDWGETGEPDPYNILELEFVYYVLKEEDWKWR